MTITQRAPHDSAPICKSSAVPTTKDQQEGGKRQRQAAAPSQRRSYRTQRPPFSLVGAYRFHLAPLKFAICSKRNGQWCEPCLPNSLEYAQSQANIARLRRKSVMGGSRPIVSVHNEDEEIWARRRVIDPILRFGLGASFPFSARDLRTEAISQWCAILSHFTFLYRCSFHPFIVGNLRRIKTSDCSYILFRKESD